LLLGSSSALLLLGDHLANVFLLKSQLLALHVEELKLGGSSRRRDGGRSGAAGTGDAVGVIVEGIAEEEVVVGEIGSWALFAVGRERIASGP